MGAKSIFKVLSVGDVVFSSDDGHPIKITKLHINGFDSSEGYYSFDDHRKKFYLTESGYNDSINRKVD